MCISDSRDISNTCFGKRYDFARGFIPSSITILEGSNALYNLSELESLQKSRTNCVLLKAIQTGEALATLHYAMLRSDVIEISSREDGGDVASPTSLRIPLQSFLNEYILEDMSQIFIMNVPHPALLGSAAGSKLVWRVSTDHSPMELYTVTGLGTTTASSHLLARASFSQTASNVKLTAIDTTSDINETLLICILISASIIEARLSKKHRKEQESKSLKGVNFPRWEITPVGVWPSC